MGNTPANIQHLKECLYREVMVSHKPFSWFKTLHRAFKCPERRFNFWWRIASYLDQSKKFKNTSLRINRNLRRKYGLDMKLGAHIGAGLRVSHYVGIVISESCVIGENFSIRQNTTIGVVDNDQMGKVYIGDNVYVGANCCIIGDGIEIGNNVTIGAMAFINRSIPDNCIAYTPKPDLTIREASVLYRENTTERACANM